MDSPLSLEITVSVFAAHQQGDGFDSDFFAGLNIDNLRFQTAPLDPALIHAQEHVRPIARFGAARAGMNGDERIRAIAFAGKKLAQLEFFEFVNEAVVFGSDGTFDSSKFSVDGSYISFFAPDVTTIPADAAVVGSFKKQFPGATSPFGAPNYVLAQMYASAITRSCGDGKTTRAEIRKNFAKVSLGSTILGTPIKFTANGDLAGASFHIFKIVNGKYQTVQ